MGRATQHERNITAGGEQSCKDREPITPEQLASVVAEAVTTRNRERIVAVSILAASKSHEHREITERFEEIESLCGTLLEDGLFEEGE